MSSWVYFVVCTFMESMIQTILNVVFVDKLNRILDKTYV